RQGVACPEFQLTRTFFPANHSVLMLDTANPISHHPPPSALRALLKSEAGGGVVLMLAAAIALVIANSPLAPAYFGLLKTYVGGLSILHWINDALMAALVFVVCLARTR